MICQEVMELMQRYLDRDLSDMEYDKMSQHMRDCPSCLAMFERLKHLSDELDRLPKVVPPYSLVDSILPQLEQLDLERSDATSPRQAELARPIGEKQDSGNARLNRTRTRFPYKSLTGIVAAGLIIVFFVLNQNNQKTVDNAEQILMSQAADQKMDAADTAKSADQFMKKEMSQDLAGGAASTESIEAPKADSAVKEQTETPPNTAAAGDNSTKVLSGTASSRSSVKSSSSDQADASANRVEESAKATNNSQNEQQPTAPVSTPPPNQIGKTGDSGDNEAASDAPAAGTLEPNADQSNMGITGGSNVAVSAPILDSADGEYRAQVEERRVVIVQVKTNKKAFKSERVAAETDHIVFETFDTAHVLVYRIDSQDKTNRYTVNLQDGTETENKQN